MNFELLEQIIKALKEFDSTENQGKASFDDFVQWLQYWNSQDSINSNHPNKKEWQNSIEVGISRLLVHLYRYARIHIRNSMIGFPELIHEDFTYLYSLIRFGSLTKTQLIEKNIHEKPTGQEIIKRLIHHGLILEENDLTDRRSKRLTVTRKGRETYFQTQEITSNVAKVITGKLTLNEKQNLFYLLKKLDHFHNPIFLNRETRDLSHLLDLVNS